MLMLEAQSTAVPKYRLTELYSQLIFGCGILVFLDNKELK